MYYKQCYRRLVVRRRTVVPKRVTLREARGRRCAGNEVVLTIHAGQIALFSASSFFQLSAPASRLSSRKEVIQPQVPLRLPCYDLVPVTDLTFGTPESRRLRALPASMT